MGEYKWRSPNEGRLRARVEARRKREEQIDSLRSDLDEKAGPTLSAISQASKEAARGVREVTRVPRNMPRRLHSQMPGGYPYQIQPRLLAGIATALVLLIGLVVFLTHAGSGRPKTVIAAPSPTSTPDVTMAEVKLLSQVNPPKAPVRVLVLGSDQRPDDPAFRTDVVMLLTIDGENNRVSAVSFPRDLIVKIPGYGEDRINLVMQYGGFKLMQDTLEQNFGARPDFYVMTNFDGFVGMVNSIGGIDVQIAQHFEDECDLNWSRGGACTVEPGKLNMDGATALWYIRSRHTSSDFDRLRRAQEVTVAVFDKFMEMHAILRLPALYQQYTQDVSTNMGVSDVLSLMPTAALTLRDPKRISRYAITPDMTTNYWTAAGAEVLLPDYATIRDIVRQASFSAQ